MTDQRHAILEKSRISPIRCTDINESSHSVSKQVFWLVTIVNSFLERCVNIFGPDLLYSLSHACHDSRTFDFFDVSVSETRWVVLSEPPAI